MASVSSIRATDCHLACGLTHSLSLERNSNDLYVWGKGNCSTVGQAGPLGPNYQLDLAVPQKVENNSLISRCVSVHAASRYSVLLHENGSVTLWAAPPSMGCQQTQYLFEDSRTGETLWGPADKEQIPRGPTSRLVKAAAIACGAEHILMADTLGRAFSWGIGINGVLGHGNLDNCTVAKQIQSLKGTFVIGVAAGSRHSLCCGVQGELFSWGNGDQGKLGLGDASGRAQPMKVNVDFNVAAVACGESHSACISDTGDLFTWGSGAFGRLGLGFESGELSFPTRLDFFKAKKLDVIQVSLGMLHSACVAIDTESKLTRLFVWGSGSNGKLGNGSLKGTNQILPVECFPGVTGFVEVRCGPSHTLVMMENGEIISMGPEGAPWLGNRRKQNGFLSFDDYVIEAFASLSSSLPGRPSSIPAATTTDSNFSNHFQTNNNNYYVIDFDDNDKLQLTSDQILKRDNALRDFIEKGFLPMNEDGCISVEVVQYILWSQTWNGPHGISDSSLTRSRKSLSQMMEDLKQDYLHLDEAVRHAAIISAENRRCLKGYFRMIHLGENEGVSGSFSKTDRAAREAYRDQGGLYSIRDYLPTRTKYSVREMAEATQSNMRRPFTSCFPSVLRNANKKGALDIDDEEFFAEEDFKAAGLVLSHLLTNPERVMMLWSSLRSTGQKRDEDMLELFLGFCRDLYVVTDMRSSRLFQTLLHRISLSFLQQIANANSAPPPTTATSSIQSSSNIVQVPKERATEVISMEIVRDGIVPKLLRTTYLNSREVRRYFAEKAQPLLDILLGLEMDLDLDPFTVTQSLAMNKSTGNGAGLVYLKPPEEQLPLDLREANLKRLSIFETKAEVRRSLEPKFDVITTIIDLVSSILTDMCSNLPFGLGDALEEYHRNLVWCFFPRESKEKCCLAIMRLLFHLSFASVMAEPDRFGMSLPSTLPRDFMFNLAQTSSLLDRCFTDSKQLFEQPWFGPLGSVARRFRQRMMDVKGLIGKMSPVSSGELVSGFPLAESHVEALDVMESNMLREIVHEKIRTEGLTLCPTRRTLEFLRHRIVPFLIELPNVQERSTESSSEFPGFELDDDTELTAALDHLQESLSPKSESIRKIQSGSFTSTVRRDLFAATRTLSRRSSRLFRRSSLLAKKKQTEEEKRINYWDFADDWGFGIPIELDLESFEERLDKLMSVEQNNHQFRERASDVILRIIETFLSMSWSNGSASSSPSLFHLLAKEMPDQKKELARFTKTSSSLLTATTNDDVSMVLSAEDEQHFTAAVVEKVLENFVERVKSRVALSYKHQTLSMVSQELHRSIQKFEQSRVVLEQYKQVLMEGNGSTQNRKVAEGFAAEANIALTPVVRMARKDSFEQPAKSRWFFKRRGSH